MLPVRAAARFGLRRATAVLAPKALAPGSRPFSNLDEDGRPPQYLSEWNKWFPYEPVPRSPQLSPYKVKVERGVDYFWCSCGESKNQPWCDSAVEKGHGGSTLRCTRSSSFVPTHYESPYTCTALMCGCKHGVGVPRGVCDYTCHMMWIDNNFVQSMGYAFIGSFAFGLVTTWFFHP